MKLLSINYVIFDQAIISGSNFLIAVFLAKFLSPSDYGLYIFAFTTIVLATGLANNSINIPLTLVGANARDARWSNTLGTFSCLLAGLSVVVFAVLLLLFVVLKGGEYDANARVLLAVAVIAPLVIWYEFIRSAQLTRLRIYRVLLMDMVTYVARVASVVLAVLWGVRDCTLIVYIFGFASIIGLLLGGYLLILEVDLQHFKLDKVIAQEAWKSGKWTLADWVPFVIYGQAYIYIVAFVLGNHDNGVLGVGRNLVAPVLVILLSLNSSFLPYLRGLCLSGQYQRMETQILKVFAYLGACIVLYLTVACFFAQNILRFFSTYYANYTSVVYLYAATMLVHFIYKPADLFLLAHSRTKYIFLSRLFTAIPTILLCYPIVRIFRLEGALYVNLLAHTLLLISLYFSFFITWRRIRVMKSFVGESTGAKT